MALDQKAKGMVVVLGEDTSRFNNNETDLVNVIKEEPVDDHNGEAEEDVLQVSAADDANHSIVIKTEPRVLDEEEEEEEEDGIIDVDGMEQNKAEEEEEEEDDIEIDDDLDDLDFELEDTSDSFSTSEGTSIRSESKLSEISISPESFPEKGEENDDEDEDNDAKTLFIEGMKIETIGNYSKCPKCLKKIKSTFIIRHIKLHDLPPERYDCPEKNCNLQVNRINNLFRHLREIHKSRKPYLCRKKDCGARFAKVQQLKNHNIVHRNEKRRWNEQENENRLFPCEFPGCGKEYKKRHHLKEHERKHTGDMKYACDVCGKRFYIQAHMKRHLYSHTGIKPHVCRWKCGAIFASYGGRMKHERINHYKENPLKSECNICGRPFTNQQQLVKHQMTHLNPEERKDYRCSFCHIMFDTIKLRQRHEERHREGEVFSCETCQRVFKNEKNLSHHIKTHHVKVDEKSNSSKGNSSSSAVKKKEPPPKHHCHICGPPKLFCLTSLRRHLARIHSTNYKCPREECGKYFKEKSQLDAHVEIHRLRECHLCGKKFQRKQNADIHLLGVHGLTKDDLATLGRWNPKKNLDKCPEYMTRKTSQSFKKFRDKKKREENSSTTSLSEEADASDPLTTTSGCFESGEEEEDGPRTIEFVAVDEIKQEPDYYD